MNTHVARPVIFDEGIYTPVNAQTHGVGDRVRRYANFAATIALVLAVAVGGWFAAMQLQPGDPDPRFAVIPATPEGIAQTCDVEPLPVDRVMEIVKNPAYFMTGGPTAVRGEMPLPGSPPDAELWEVDVPLGLIGGRIGVAGLAIEPAVNGHVVFLVQRCERLRMRARSGNNGIVLPGRIDSVVLHRAPPPLTHENADWGMW